MVFAVMMVMSIAANAAVATETLTSNLETVASYFEGYGVFHYYNFKTMSRDGGEAQSFTLAPDAVDNLMPITTPDMEIFSVAIGRGSADTPDLRWRDASYGLYEFGSGARTLRISSLKAGMIVVIQGAQGQKYDYYETGVANASEAEEITTEVTEKMNEGIEEGQEAVTNPYRYFRILTDGKFDFSVNRGCYIMSLAVLIDQSAGESVSTPSLKIVGVNGDSRKLEFKPGESTMGNETKTFYSLDGSDPIYLKDSEEVATWTYTYDEETGAKLDSVPETYKKVLDTDMVAQVGTYGDYEFNPEDGSIDVFGSDDEDGDGIVVVKAAAVSLETGVVSDVVTINVSIGEIALNAPSASLVAVNGEDRTFLIAWANNTLCGENYVIKVEGDNGDYYNEYEENVGIGEKFTVKKDFKITVSVNGYKDGVYEQDVDLVGTDFKRKNASQDEEGKTIHDYDFVNVSKEMYNKFAGNVVASYEEYVKNGEVTDTIAHTVAEYEAAEAAEQDVSNWAAIPQTFGWWLPIASNRTTLNVIEGGVDKNANGYGYVEEQIGIFKNLAVSCPPNTSNASTIFKYVDKADGNELGYLGVYFMDKPTITFPREVAKAGEYVEIYYGQGGSNYTTSTTHKFYEVPADGFLSVTLPSGGVHVFYIDVYTYDNLPEDLLENAEEAWKEVVAVEGVETENAAAVIYTASGARIQSIQKGLNIVKYANGQVKKVLVK